MALLSESLTVPADNAGARPHQAREADDNDIESAWIDAARDDPRAFAPLYDRYATLIYRFCYRKVGDPDVANDLTTQIFSGSTATRTAMARPSGAGSSPSPATP
ncbi:MAG: hypothetical protein M3412_03195 [Chloroflexota bacterium]|nr:hypothetical protein [Chloroflexota bacterium]